MKIILSIFVSLLIMFVPVHAELNPAGISGSSEEVCSNADNGDEQICGTQFFINITGLQPDTYTYKFIFNSTALDNGTASPVNETETRTYVITSSQAATGGGGGDPPIASRVIQETVQEIEETVEEIFTDTGRVSNFGKVVIILIVGSVAFLVIQRFRNKRNSTQEL